MQMREEREGALFSRGFHLLYPEVDEFEPLKIRPRAALKYVVRDL